MAEYQTESPEVVAKEITLSAMSKLTILAGETGEPNKVGNKCGKLYKTILKNVREAIHEKKYD